MSPTFFTDRDLGTRFPDILRNAGLSVERHRDHFLPNAADEQWLEMVGRCIGRRRLNSSETAMHVAP